MSCLTSPPPPWPCLCPCRPFQSTSPSHIACRDFSGIDQVHSASAPAARQVIGEEIPARRLLLLPGAFFASSRCFTLFFLRILSLLHSCLFFSSPFLDEQEALELVSSLLERANETIIKCYMIEGYQVSCD